MTHPTIVSIRHLDQKIGGPRIVESRVSPLRVYSGQWPHLLTQLPEGIPPTPGTYLLTRPSISGLPRTIVRPGEAVDLRRRLQEHSIDPTKADFAEVHAISAVDDRLSKADCRYFEARLHELVAGNPTSVLEVDRIPAVQNVAQRERDDLEALLDQARLLLSASGCIALDAAHVPFRHEDGPIKEEGIVEVSGNIALGSHDEHELLYDGCWARGFPTADGWIVRAGSDVRRRENLALLPTIVSRRRLLLEKGVLTPLPGVSDRWRLMTDVFCSSSLLAAKIVSGAHVTARGIWQRISPAARMVSAK